MPAVSTRSPSTAQRDGDFLPAIVKGRRGGDPLTPDDVLPIFPGTARIEVWRDGHTWRIGPRGEKRSPQLPAVLNVAMGDEVSAASWALLLRAEFDRPAVDALLAQLTSKFFGQCLELTPLLARLALDYPAEIAATFPRACGVEVLQLCGEHGVAAAMRTLKSKHNCQHRWSAGLALELFAGRGVTWPVEAVQAALARESDYEAKNRLRDALLAQQRAASRQPAQKVQSAQPAQMARRPAAPTT